jgi:dipeptidyl aminopeptidase/acylaminoacyl peptidase
MTTLPVLAQNSDESGRYIEPPESVIDIIDTDKNFATLDAVSPDGRHFLVPLTTEFSTLEKMSKDTYRLAMLEIRPKTNRGWYLDTFGIYGLRIYSLGDRSFVDIAVPDDTIVSDMMWSPDGKQLAFLAHLPEGTEVWTADLATGKAQSMSDTKILATLAARPSYRRPASAPSRFVQWTSRNTILTLMVPSDRGPEPERSLPAGPIVRRTREKAAPTSTQPFLLQDEYDAALFRYYTTAQLVEISPGKAPRKIGEPAMYLDFSLSPDGKYVLAEKIVDPLSYIVRYTNFPRDLDVMDLEGKILSTLRNVPLQEDMSQRSSGATEDLPRGVAWYPQGATLGFLWREEKGDEGTDEEDSGPPRRDRLMALSAPFDLTQAKTLVQTEEKESFSEPRYSLEGDTAFVTIRGSGNNGKTKERLVSYDLTEEKIEEMVLVKDYDPEDLVNLPGELWTRATSNGVPYVLLSSKNEHVYLTGAGHREDMKPRPFVDRVTMANGAKERLFEGSADMYERPLVPLDRDLNEMIINRESKTVFPDSFLWSGDSAPVNLTNNIDPFPAITAAKRIDFTFERRDGLEIHGRISLPIGYQEGSRVPAMFWTYPSEYSSVEEYEQDAMGDRNQNAYNHLRYLRWSDIWLTQGYALVSPDVPIIKKDQTYNDNYIQHLVDSLYGAIRKVDQMGYVDVDRIGHGGHSYGAFATANLLAHSPFFKAGIAGNGAYNRTLTPMGFQNEERFIWEAEDVYLEMSPFFNADHIDTPLLLYHGADDNNTGTYPIQSDRLIQALTGLGKTAVLYKYPFESHSPRAKKTYLDFWARWLQWFDKFVKKSEAK